MNKTTRPCARSFAITALSLALTGAAALHAPRVQAGSFSVSPVRIYMTPRDRAVAVTLMNEGDTDVALQADLNEWTQTPDGTDELRLTEDLILSPPIIKLAPRSRQVVRLALLKPADASRQLTYRLIVREVPEITAPKDRNIQVPIALVLSMPVFITPAPARRDVSCTAERANNTQAGVTCNNRGSAYAQVREVLLQRGDQTLARFEGGAYILPGARKQMVAVSTEPLTPGPVRLAVQYDDGKSETFETTLP
jgi:fimbrial chaperone protein